MKSALTVGTFDMLHPGHLNLFRRCHDMADRVIVGLNTDEFVTRFKGHPPVMDFRARRLVLEECRLVDAVVANMGNEDGKQIIDWVRPNLLVVGDDWAPPRDYFAQMGMTREWLDSLGVSLVFVPYTAYISSTRLRERIADEAGSRSEHVVRGSGTG